MKHDWVKIPLVAEELGVSVKTVYNWVAAGKLFMPKRGFVSQVEAYEVWLHQQSLRSFYSYFQSVKGTSRDGNGRFKSREEPVEESGV